MPCHCTLGVRTTCEGCRCKCGSARHSMLQGGAGKRDVLEQIGKKTDYLRDTLGVLDRLTDETGQLLDSLGRTLYDLNHLTAPIKSRASALTVAQTNIVAAKSRVDELVDHVSTSRRVSA